MYLIIIFISLLSLGGEASHVLRFEHLNRRIVLAVSGTQPKYAVDPDTTKSCTWWFDSTGGARCQDVVTDFAISLELFQSWVIPSIKMNHIAA